MLVTDDPNPIIDNAIELSGRRMFGPKHFAEAADVPFVRAQRILGELVAAGYVTALGNGQYKKRGVLDAQHKKATKKRSNPS